MKWMSLDPGKWLLAFSLFLAMIWLMAMVYIARSSLSYSVLNLPFDSRANRAVVRSFFPEGFGFFTRDPQEARLYIYKLENGQIIPLSRPNATFGHLFGISRKGRAQNIELGQLLGQLQKMPWRECKNSLAECVSPEWPENKIKNHNIYPLLCGDIIIQVKKPIPWAWHRDFKAQMPSEIIKVTILCDT